MQLTKNLQWRYATKRFDASKKVSEESLKQIKEAVALSASSYGLQPYRILIIEDEALRKQLQPVSWGQPQIVDASHLIVFCHYTGEPGQLVEDYIELKAGVQQLNPADMEGYKTFVVNKLSEYSPAEFVSWTARQAYIALGTLLAACAELNIDACPMEGFEPEQYNTLLGLEGTDWSASVVATIGYRSGEDKTQHARKVRKPLKTLFEAR